MNTKRALERRAFLKFAAAWPVLATGLGIAAAPEKNAGEVPSRTLGKTGLKLPILGYGGAALPKEWGNPLSHDERVALVRYAFDRGVRYFDTAPNYKESQAILGEALKDRRRDACLATKVDGTDPKAVRRMVEASLKTLQTDHVDILLMHGTPGIEQMTVETAMEMHGQMIKLRDAKLTRFIGLSAHGYFDKALALIATGGFDVFMPSCGYIPRGYDQIWSARMTTLRDACMAKAHELGMGIVAMKVIGAGMLGAWSGAIVPSFDKERLAQLPAAAIRHVLQDPRVHMLNIGMRFKKEIDANIGILSADTAYTPADRALLAEFSAKLYESEAIKKMRIE